MLSSLSSFSALTTRRGLVALGAATALTVASARESVAAPTPAPGFLTSRDAMLEPATPGVRILPILSVGDTLPGGHKFEAIPDGVAVRLNGRWTAEVFVNHETSTVPFPLPVTTTTVGDFHNAQVSRLILRRNTAGVLAGEDVIPSSANYQRFCSSFLAGRAHGFERPMLLTNEESDALVYRTGTAWPVTPGDPKAEQAGMVVVYDLRSRRWKSVPGLGRMNHENTVAVPGYGKPVLITGDDTFAAPSSQLFMYVADDAFGVWNDFGTLYAFRSANPAVNDYGDLGGTGAAQTSGEFVAVPKDVATGDQKALEDWCKANGVFQFIRVEDIATDRQHPNVVYFADTGEPRAIPDTATGQLKRGPSGTIGAFPNGRIFKLVLDTNDPTKVTSLSVLIDGDRLGAAGVKDPALIHQPDNIETTSNSILIQEDPGSHNQYAPGDPGATTARIWRYDLATGQLTVVARVRQRPDPALKLGAWESSGIVDASPVFGPGMFLVTVQSNDVVDRDVQNGMPVEREDGQLLLIHIPGA